MEIIPLKNDQFRFILSQEQKSVLIAALSQTLTTEKAKQNPDPEALKFWQTALERWQAGSKPEAELSYDEADYLHQALYRFKDTSLSEEDRKKVSALFAELDTYFPDEEE